MNTSALTIAWLLASTAATSVLAQPTPFDDPPRPRVAAPASAPDATPAKARAVRRAAPVRVRAANQSHGGEPALSCRTIHWKRGDIIRLHAQPYKQVHVALPENGIDVIMGDKELWALDWINNRIFIKPTSRSSEGRSTTISAIGQSGNAYEFLVTRMPDGAEISHCVYIQADGGLITRSAWTQAQAGSSEAMTREILGLRERNTNLERQSREGMKAYRKKLNSHYAWSSGVFSRWQGGDVESVYDDGRFTYVRMKEGGQGLVSIMAEIDGKALLLEYNYDAPTRTYQISGVFPKFTLHSGKQTLAITRKGEREQS